MTVEEFSNQFDILYNNITSNQAPGLDEYEKSIFLTKAQDELVKGYFNPIFNKSQQGYDGSQRRHIDFSMITKAGIIKAIESVGDDPTRPLVKNNIVKDANSFDSRAYKVSLNEKDILMILNEQLCVTRGNSNKEITLTVLPVDYPTYDILMSKPYKRPLKHQAWRLLQNNTSAGTDAKDSEINLSEVYVIPGANDTIESYRYRYIKRPRPIILDDLELGLTINGCSTKQTSELDPIMHQDIVQRAAELAKAVYTGSLADQIALGQTSQTGLGIVSRGGGKE